MTTIHVVQHRDGRIGVGRIGGDNQHWIVRLPEEILVDRWTPDEVRNHRILDNSIFTETDKARTALADLLFAINVDKPDGYFLGQEAEPLIRAAEAALEDEVPFKEREPSPEPHYRAVLDLSGGLVQSVRSEVKLDLLILDSDFEGCDPADLIRMNDGEEFYASLQCAQCTDIDKQVVAGDFAKFDEHEARKEELK